jgi:DNA processing protein
MDFSATEKYFARGVVNSPGFAAVAIVGSREISTAAKRATIDFAAFLAYREVSVISGLARGCDSAAHTSCLESGGHTVAVLPCGLNYIAPASNRPLAKRILESGGGLVSEYPADTPPRNFQFVARNRLVSALSHAVIIMEAEESSGSLHTARFALEHRKPLACYVPKSGSLSSGCRDLLENRGAVPLRNVWDLASFLGTLSNATKATPSSWQGRGEGVGASDCHRPDLQHSRN